MQKPMPNMHKHRVLLSVSSLLRLPGDKDDPNDVILTSRVFGCTMSVIWEGSVYRLTIFKCLKFI